MPMLTATSDHLRLQLTRQFIGMRSVEHRNYAATRIRGWQLYENMKRDATPSDAIMAADTVGIPPYYVPDLTVVDRHGLTDATVARNPVTRPNQQRIMAHDRRPPSGYLEKRGVNFIVYPPASGERPEAFGARYAGKVGRDLWMPFNSPDHQWVIERFAGRDLRIYAHPTDPSVNRLQYNGRLYVWNPADGRWRVRLAVRDLGRLERGAPGRRVRAGVAVTLHRCDVLKEDGKLILCPISLCVSSVCLLP